MLQTSSLHNSPGKTPDAAADKLLPADEDVCDGVSVVLICLNEEANLRRTLESVRWADEIVVVDSGSTDSSLDIAREYQAKVIHQDWLGFAAQKNLAISHSSRAWVLSLDADEMVDDRLQQAIRKVVSTGSDRDGFYANRRNYFLGRWVKHGGFYPDAKLRLFKRGAAWFGETEVHETVRCKGTTGTLSGDLHHHAYSTLETYMEHMNRYSSLGARQVLKRGKRSGLLSDAVLRPMLTFFYNYICRTGFLDGAEGLLLHLYHSVYVSLKYAKAWDEGRGRFAPVK